MLRDEQGWGRSVPFLSPDGESVVPVPVWLGVDSFADAVDEEERSWIAAIEVRDRVLASPSYDARRRVAVQVLAEIDNSLQLDGWHIGPIVWLVSHCDVYRLLQCMQVFRGIIDVTYRRTHPVFSEDRVNRVQPNPQLQTAVMTYAPTLRALALRLLAESGQPLDEWHQATALSCLMFPRFVLATVSFMFWHPPPPAGQTDRERQYASAVGATDKTERLALKSKRDLQSRAGVVFRRAKPGPKPGSHRAIPSAQIGFERYLTARASQGVSPAIMTADAELQRLYRVWKGDVTAGAGEQVVRYHLRRVNAKSR
jgi:hypothetical protein